MIINGKRALAHIQTITKIEPIPMADNIELVTLLGWKCIAKKGEFQEGDRAVYIEIDSKVPSKDKRFAFLASKDYKVKTYKLNKFGVISQGLALPITLFPELDKKAVGDDVTAQLGITYAVAEDNVRKADKPKGFWKRVWYWIAGRFFPKSGIVRSTFPSRYCSKTDEERIQNAVYLLEDKQPYVVTEKIDGTSSTYVLVRHDHRFRASTYEFIVSSRNVRQEAPAQPDNVYWEMATKYDLENVMKKMLEQLPHSSYIVLQGETFGKNIQGNKYKMDDRDIRFFNLIDDHNGKWDPIDSRTFAEKFDLKWVPIVNEEYVLPDTVDEILQAATGPSVINPTVLREGWVLRREEGKDQMISFKAVSPEFLIKNKE